MRDAYFFFALVIYFVQNKYSAFFAYEFAFHPISSESSKSKIVSFPKKIDSGRSWEFWEIPILIQLSGAYSAEINFWSVVPKGNSLDKSERLLIKLLSKVFFCHLSGFDCQDLTYKLQSAILIILHLSRGLFKVFKKFWKFFEIF